jgi:hypothetical protein
VFPGYITNGRVELSQYSSRVVAVSCREESSEFRVSIQFRVAVNELVSLESAVRQVVVEVNGSYGVGRRQPEKMRSVALCCGLL